MHGVENELVYHCSLRLLAVVLVLLITINQSEASLSSNNRLRKKKRIGHEYRALTRLSQKNQVNKSVTRRRVTFDNEEQTKSLVNATASGRDSERSKNLSNSTNSNSSFTPRYDYPQQYQEHPLYNQYPEVPITPPTNVPSVTPSTALPTLASSQPSEFLPITNPPSTNSPTITTKLSISPTTSPNTDVPTPTLSLSPAPTEDTTDRSSLPPLSSTFIPSIEISSAMPSSEDSSTLAPFATPTFTENPSIPTPTTEIPTSETTFGPTDSTTLDSFFTFLTYQEESGICGGPSNGVGCASEDPNQQLTGNPNDIFNCFDVNEFGVEVPFKLDYVRFWIGDSSPPPPDMELIVIAGSKQNGPIDGIILYSQQLFDFATGENTVEIDLELLLFQTSFCVGVTSRSMNGGLRIQTTISETILRDDASYIRAPECGIPNFVSLVGAGLRINFCIEALVVFGDNLMLP